MWNAANYLAQHFESFENIMDDMFKIIKVKIENYEEVSFLQ